MIETIPTQVDIPTSTGGWVTLVLKLVVLPLLVMGAKTFWSWAETRKGNDALGRVLGLLDVVGQPIWDRQMVRVQEALADGVITPAEREQLLKAIADELPNLIQRDTLQLAMKALGVPDIGGLASWVLSKLLARWKGAHDVTDPTVPAALTGVYPVQAIPGSNAVAAVAPANVESGG